MTFVSATIDFDKMHARFGKKSGIFVVVKWTKFAPEFGVEKSVLNQVNIFFLSVRKNILNTHWPKEESS